MTTRNQKQGDAAEDLSSAFFSISKVSGSGRGVNKLDLTDEFKKAEIKSTRNKSYSITKDNLDKWRLAASKEGKNFFCHVYFSKENGTCNIEDSVVLIHPRLLKSLLEKEKLLDRWELGEML